MIDQEFDEIISVDETRRMSNLQIRICLTNGDDSGLIEGECASLVAYCCKTNNSEVRKTKRVYLVSYKTRS